MDKDAPLKSLTETFEALQRDGINAPLKNTNTLLIEMTSEGYTDVALALIKAKAKLDEENERGNTALIRAACENRVEIARALVKAGATLNITNDDNYTAKMLAKRRGHMEIYSIIEEEEKRRNPEGPVETVGDVGNSPKTPIQTERNKSWEQKIIAEVETLAPAA